ncbi:MAG: hypothetical protein IJ424_07520 [Oscillospiraceae bacterium]|nr:hypothetical protein [Oscillospiraceae bacterium]
MKDFFDEDFPLSKKQEEELNKRALTPKTLEEPIVEESENPNPPAYDPDNDRFSYIPLDEDEPIDEAFSYTPPEDEEEALEETAEKIAKETDDEDVENAAEEASEAAADEKIEEPLLEDISEEDSPETLAFDFFDEPVEEEKAEEAVADEQEKAPAVSHDEYLAKLRQMNEIEEQLQREIKSLGEQLDSVEMKVDNLPDEVCEEACDEEPKDFSYEYDERYFAEEETPAYKHPELYKKQPAKTKPKAKKKASKNGELTLNVKTLVGVGAAVAAAVAAAKLLGGGNKK